MLRQFVCFQVIFVAGLAIAGEQETRKVIASIKPLALIAEALVEGCHIEVDTLLPPASSPHNYALKISDARRLQTADLVIWLGEEAEPYIHPGKINQHLPLLDGIGRNNLIKGGDAHGDHHHLVDPHIWLDPVLAQEVAVLIVKRLVALYPDRRAQLEKNLAIFRGKTSMLDQKLNTMVESYRDKGFLSYHDAYAYFVRRYGLKQLGVVQEQVGGTMSVKHLVDLQSLIQPGETVCLFREPQFANASIPKLPGGGASKNGLLDPLGIEAGSYEQLLETLANQLVSCLAEG